MPLRVAVVGAGLMGRWHADAAERCGAEVAAVVDVDAAAAEALAARRGRRSVRTFRDLATCLEDCAVDVVHVCTPSATHGPPARTAVETGCHVLVEKPLTDSVAETDALLLLAAGAGVKVNPVHQFPFQPGVRALLERRSELGDIVRVAFRTSSAGGAGWSAEERRALIADIVPHPVSLFQRFAPGFDPAGLEIEVRDEDLVLAGRHGRVFLEAFITLRGRPPCNELHLTGTRASALADLFHGYAVFDRGPASGLGKATRPFVLGTRLLAGASFNGVSRAVRLESAYPGLRRLVGAFYRSVQDGSPPPISADEITAAAVVRDAVLARLRRIPAVR